MRRQRILIGIVILLFAIGAAMVLTGRRLAGEGLESALRAAGLPVDSLTVAAIDWNSARLRAVVLANGAVRIAEAEADFDLRRLIGEGRLDVLTLRGVDIAAPLSALAAPGEDGEGPGSLPELPFDRLTVIDAETSIATPAGPIALSVPGLAAATRADGGLQFRAEARLAGAAGEATLRLAGLVAPDLRTHLAMVLDDGAVSADGVRAAGLTGLAATTLDPGGLRSLAGILAAAEAVQTPGPALQDVALWGSAGPGLERLSFRAGLPALAGRAAVDVQHPEAATESQDIEATGAPESLRVSALATTDRLEAVAMALGVEAAGRGRIDTAVTVPVSALQALVETGDWPAEAGAEGTLALRLDRLAMPGLVDGGRLSLEGGLQAGQRSFHLRGLRPWRVSGTWEALDAPAALILGSPDQPPDFDLRFDEDGQAVLGLKGPVRALSRLGGVFGNGRSVAEIDGDGRLGLLGWEAELTALPLRLGNAWIEPERLAVNGTFSNGVVETDVIARLGLDGTFGPDIHVARGTVQLAGGLRIAEGRAEFRPRGCVDIAAARVRLGAGAALPEGLAICLAAGDDAALLATEIGGPEGGLGTVAIDAAVDGVRLPLAVGDVRADLAMGALRIEGDFHPGGERHDIDVRLAEAGIAVPELGMAAEELTLTARFRADAAEPLTIELNDGRLLSLETPPWHAPLRLTGSGAVDEAGQLAFRADGTGAGGGLRVIARGEIAETGDGHVALSLLPVSLAPGIRPVRTLFPVLAETPIRRAEGTLTADLSYGWGTQARDWARIDLTDLDLFTDVVPVFGVDGRLVVAQFSPLVLADGQALAIDGVVAGLPLRDGRVVFGFRSPDRLSVSMLSFELAGGTIRAEPFTLSLDDRSERRIILRAENIDMAQLMALVEVPNLEASGRLNGRLPIRLIDDTIRIDDASLETQGAGVIRYTGSNLAGLGAAAAVSEEGANGEGGAEIAEGGVGLLAQAIRNFHYESLSLGLSGEVGGEMAGTVRIRGANPELYGGYPIALNVNLSGALSEILRQGLESGRLAERLEEHYRRRAGGAVTDDVIDSLEAIQE